MKVRHQRIGFVIFAAILALILGGFVFKYFQITTEARLCLREGKNIKLALDMLTIECYGEGSTVYDPKEPDGIKDSVRQQVYDITDNQGSVRLLAYDRSKRQVLQMTYEKDSYRVIYQYDEENKDQWKVDYLVNIFDYSD